MIQIHEITPNDGYAAIYRSCSFEYLAQGMKDSYAFHIVLSLRHNEQVARELDIDVRNRQSFTNFEQWAKDQLSHEEN